MPKPVLKYRGGKGTRGSTAPSPKKIHELQ